MAKAVKVQKGQTIDFTASGAAIGYSDVVPLVNRIGVALEDIADGDTGSLAVAECWELPAISTAAFAVGDVVFWDATAQKLTNVGSENTPAGIVITAKVESGTTAVVDIGFGGYDRQANVVDITTVDGSDAGTTQALANATKAKVNALLAALRSAGIIG